MKRSTWITSAVAASVAVPMLLTLLGCSHDHRDDRDDRDRNSWRSQGGDDRHDERRDERRDDDHRN